MILFKFQNMFFSHMKLRFLNNRGSQVRLLKFQLPSTILLGVHSCSPRKSKEYFHVKEGGGVSNTWKCAIAQFW